jgi:hypothetical protein
MISCITLKNTSFKLLKVKNVTEENIYKKCGYKTPVNFKKIHTWNLDDKYIELWSKEDTNSKKYNQHNILTKYSIKLNVNNKCIFFLRNKENFINLETEVFNKYFDLKETIEISKDDINENNNDTNDTDDTNDVNLTSDINKTNELLNKLLHNSNSENEENFEFNSELSYELYSYSEDEEEEDVSGCVISKVK